MLRVSSIIEDRLVSFRRIVTSTISTDTSNIRKCIFLSFHSVLLIICVCPANVLFSLNRPTFSRLGYSIPTLLASILSFKLACGVRTWYRIRPISGAPHLVAQFPFWAWAWLRPVCRRFISVNNPSPLPFSVLSCTSFRFWHGRQSPRQIKSNQINCYWELQGVIESKRPCS